MIDLATMTLGRGLHGSREVSFTEAVARFADEPHTAEPVCMSPVLAEYGRWLSYELPDEARQSLIPLIPLMPGTAADGLDEARKFLALDWLVRVYAPMWLDLAHPLSDAELSESAAELRSLQSITRSLDFRVTGPVLDTARGRATLASLAWDGSQAIDVELAATAAEFVFQTCRNITHNVAGPALSATGDDSELTWSNVIAVTEAAITVVAGPLWDAARTAKSAETATRNALTPTIITLQASAVELMRTMINPESSTWTDY
ncbi:hypothetical protein [Streptomyces sp. NBC_00233]|uniref:hypothetical protein n=1 Tax=Streptomyces sp. NBC_00233 TaxID=2975686 RepID=UPI00224FC521|nr:hypothetical protein [Streptomyces sp. NBC_00233]MCX5231446.1 hypothetical protein [Streptomyces sp. NBC_00233]MCX5233010.1 hypothetical protein [Streptomyces sp. NBC_00233]